jgi:hypothetical protein
MVPSAPVWVLQMPRTSPNICGRNYLRDKKVELHKSYPDLHSVPHFEYTTRYINYR